MYKPYAGPPWGEEPEFHRDRWPRGLIEILAAQHLGTLPLADDGSPWAPNPSPPGGGRG